jgi:hypothetical protein
MYPLACCVINHLHMVQVPTWQQITDPQPQQGLWCQLSSKQGSCIQAGSLSSLLNDVRIASQVGARYDQCCDVR